jgi:CelD/BcsL family acetyltransferase involved in cellulose biosynthesis
MLRFETLRDWKTIPSDVMALFDAAEQQDPAYGWGWFQNLVQTVFGQDPGACLQVLRRNGVAVAAVPLHLQRSRWAYTARALGNFYTCLYAPALAQSLTAQELTALFVYIKREHAPLGSLLLTPLDAQGTALPLLRQALRGAGFRLYEHTAFGNWHLPVVGSYADYLASRPGEVRNTVKRMGKKFAAAGGRLEIIDAADQVDEAMDAYLAVYRSSWKRPEPFEHFMPGLARLCASQGWLRLGLAWLGERPVAAQLWMVAAGKAYIYKLAYDEAFKHLSPGSQLTALLMQRVIDIDRVTEVDYMKGDDAYKNQWMSHRRERLGLLAFNPNTLSGLAGLVREATAQRRARWTQRRPA